MRIVIGRSQLGVSLLAAAWAVMGNAAPQVSSATGNPSHGALVTVTGSQFGSKSAPAPAAWETCPQAGLSSQWSGAWPDSSANADYDLKCRSPIREVSPPHSHVSMYLAGAHAERSGYNAGANVLIYKNRNIASYPAYGYFSWYERNDPRWVFNLGSPADNNHKLWDFSQGTSPYTMPPNWYLEHNSRFQSATDSGGAFHLLDDASNFPTSTWGSTAPSPWKDWVKMEIEVLYTKDNSGWIRVYANNKLLLDESNLPTDPYSGTQRSEAIGGFTRNTGNANNWRYFSDIYVDYTFSRVVLANAANYRDATIVEVQPVTSWAGNQIRFTTNLGKLDPSKPVYVFVFDSTGTANAVGFRLNSQAIPAPNAPASLSVL